jgi:hypothetical protein
MCKYSIDPALEFVITLLRLEADGHYTLSEMLDKDHKILHAVTTDSMVSNEGTIRKKIRK